MRSVALAILVAFGLTTVGASIGAAQAMPVKIEYWGQSFFILTTSKGVRVAFDPHAIPAYFRDPDSIAEDELKTADICTISHNHNDHIRTQIFKKEKGKPPLEVLRGLKGQNLKADWNVFEKTVGDIKFRTVPTYHDDMEGLARGKNAVFIVEVDGWRIVHLGDLGHLLTPKQLKMIGPVDVLMVPVGGIYTLNGSEASKVVEQLRPKEYIFPMHYGTKIFEDILSAEEFLDIFERKDKSKVIRLSESVREAEREQSVQLNRDPQRPRPLIVQLHYAPKQEKKKEDKKK
ncbi:MAG: MBL fold metallo-hydrolase [Planctomycetes bacterium]|nr:MBL fold metallo-hydrolase [Planctomycetota bacterium]